MDTILKSDASGDDVHSVSAAANDMPLPAASPNFVPFLGPASFLTPQHADASMVPPWMEHGPFSYWLIEALRPMSFVELGTHTGFSYFSFCQAVKHFRLGTKCYAIDTWKGDDHAGFYGEDVFERVSAINAELYAGFSELIRARFDEALPYFSNGGIDLLHIDGRHGYDDVRTDFESWFPKLSSRAVVVFHDTSVRANDFGVWKLWQELSDRYPAFEFVHGHGLGVLAVGSDVPANVLALCKAPPEMAASVRHAYSALGRAVIQKRDSIILRSELDSLDHANREAGQHIEQLRAEIDRVRAEAAASRQEIALARHALDIAEGNKIEKDRRIEFLLAEVASIQGRLTAARRQATSAEQRASGAQLALDSSQAEIKTLQSAFTIVTRERDAILYSTTWRATRPLRSLLGGDTLRPFRTALRRLMRLCYWVITLQFPRRYLEWRHAHLSLASSAVQPPPESFTGWFSAYREGVDHATVKWAGAVRFSIIMSVYQVKPKWLQEAISSVVSQTNPNWELICIDDNSQNKQLTKILQQAAESDPRIRVVTLGQNRGPSAANNAGLELATGQYVLFMDHDDLLEPHAVARFGDAAFLEESDLIYGDEVVTGESTDEILGIQARPVFSHTYYMSHPYFVHPIAIRTSLARKIGGFDPSLFISQDIDFVLRTLEQAETVTHVPDILYRWRTVRDSAGHQKKGEVVDTTSKLKRAHLQRIGFTEAEVRGGISFNTFSVRYFAPGRTRILGIIPTKNQAQLLKPCVESMRSTTTGLDLDLVIIDHQSDEPETLAYLKELNASGTARVIPYEGEFNYSAINNHAIRSVGSDYDHFLFLNNDIEAKDQGWLEAMVDLATRADVGVVGATLLYLDGSIQHSGVVVGLHGVADHAFRSLPYSKEYSGYGGSHHAAREYSAVTAACMLVPAPVFSSVGGYDEEFAVGFGDTDLCLRIVGQGYRAVNCAEAVLLHHESATRGKNLSGGDPHPTDTAAFRRRYGDFIHRSDPHFSPLLCPNDPQFRMDPSARLAPLVNYRTVSNFLPKGKRAPGLARVAKAMDYDAG